MSADYPPSPEALDAYRALLATADPPDLPTRKFTYVLPGDPLRRERIKLELERAWTRWRMVERGYEETHIVALRRTRLRLVRGKLARIG